MTFPVPWSSSAATFNNWPAIACVAVATALLLGLSTAVAESTTSASRVRRQSLA
jgi:hypothetical protein